MSQFKPVVPGSSVFLEDEAALERLMLLLARALRYSDDRVAILAIALQEIERILGEAPGPRLGVREHQTPFIAAGNDTARSIHPVEGRAPHSGDFDALSLREKQIVEHLTRGQANKVIARQLDIAEATVKVHVESILRKLGLKSRTQAALCALQEGWVRSGTSHRPKGDTPAVD